MKQIRSFADLVYSSERMLAACDENPELLAGVEPFKGALKNLLAQMRAIKTQQDQLAGLRRAATQQLGVTMDDTKEARRKLQSFVKTRMHSRNAQLTQFGIPPNGRRHRKRRAGDEPEAADEPKGSTEPVASAGTGAGEPGS
jgi:hypothetical protein